MKWKNRLTNYNFWISIVSAVLLILQAFNINFDIAYINEIATAVLGLLVVIGIINDPTRSANREYSKVLETKQVESEKVDNKKQTEEVVKESAKDETVIPFNSEDENDSNNSETDFKAIIETISQDLKHKLKEIVEAVVVNKQEETKDMGACFEEQKIEESNNELQPVEPTCYNIVN